MFFSILNDTIFCILSFTVESGLWEVKRKYISNWNVSIDAISNVLLDQIMSSLMPWRNPFLGHWLQECLNLSDHISLWTNWWCNSRMHIKTLCFIFHTKIYNKLYYFCVITIIWTVHSHYNITLMIKVWFICLHFLGNTFYYPEYQRNKINLLIAIYIFL